MKHYYGFSSWSYYPSVNSEGDRLGEVMIFESSRDRDEWVFNGPGMMRECISANEAKSFMHRAVSVWFRHNRNTNMDVDAPITKTSDVIEHYRTVCKDGWFDPYVPKSA